MDEEFGDTGMQQQPQAAMLMSSAAVLFGCSSSLLNGPGAESFDDALRELKGLRYQFNEAADCCEKAFRDTKKKL